MVKIEKDFGNIKIHGTTVIYIYIYIYIYIPKGIFRLRQTRQLPRAVDLEGRLSKLSKLLITTTPFHSLTE